MLGLIFGSFFNVVGIRIPNKESLLGRSHCPSCNRQLGAVELIPVIGYLILKGKCKECKHPISIKYPLIELITGLLFLVSFVFLRENMVEYILIVVFISLLVIITVSDLYYQIIPDIILLVFFHQSRMQKLAIIKIALKALMLTNSIGDIDTEQWIQHHHIMMLMVWTM